VCGYRFDPPQPTPGQAMQLQLAVRGIEPGPAYAAVYGLDGVRLQAGDQSQVWQLGPDRINTFSVRITPPPRGGGLAFIACQSGRSTA